MGANESLCCGWLTVVDYEYISSFLHHVGFFELQYLILEHLDCIHSSLTINVTTWLVSIHFIGIGDIFTSEVHVAKQPYKT